MGFHLRKAVAPLRRADRYRILRTQVQRQASSIFARIQSTVSWPFFNIMIMATVMLAAMVVSLVAAVYFEIIHPKLGLAPIVEWQRLVLGVAITTVGWITVAVITKPTEENTLLRFYRKINPGGPCWKRVLEIAQQKGEDVREYLSQKWDVPSELLCVFLGLVMIYSMLFDTGFWLYANILAGIITTILSILSAGILIKLWGRLKIF